MDFRRCQGLEIKKPKKIFVELRNLRRDGRALPFDFPLRAFRTAPGDARSAPNEAVRRASVFDLLRPPSLLTTSVRSPGALRRRSSPFLPWRPQPRRNLHGAPSIARGAPGTACSARKLPKHPVRSRTPSRYADASRFEVARSSSGFRTGSASGSHTKSPPVRRSGAFAIDSHDRTQSPIGASSRVR